MASVIQSIARLASQTFSRKITDDSLSQLRSLFANLMAEDVDFKGDQLEKRTDLSAPTIHMEIHHEDRFSITIFGVREGKIIPLHDHPGMYGMIKVIRGSFKVISYTPLDPESVSPPIEVINQVSSFQSRFLRSRKRILPAVLASEKIISLTENNICLLKPDEGNIHEITSIEGLSAFVDILAPPYEKGARDCHFYSVLGSSFDQRLKCDIFWLMETNAPLFYWCDSIPYTGPRLDCVKV